MELKEKKAGLSCTIDYSLICNKGNMELFSHINPENNKKAYKLEFDMNNIDPNNINIENLISHNIFELLEKLNPDLIEKISILKTYDDGTTDIVMIFQDIAKEIGVKQKFLLFRSKRRIDLHNNIIHFSNFDIIKTDPELAESYLSVLNLTDKYEAIEYNYGSISIYIKNAVLYDILNREKEEPVNLKYDLKINLKVINNFQIIIKDDLPIYMENIMGLMFKKIFYNLKKFVEIHNKLQ